MTSKLVVNTIEADTGISSVSFASSISMSSTSKFFFSAAGVDIGADTNINRPASGVLGFNINSSEKVRIDSSGRMLLGTTTEGGTGADNLTIATSGATGITVRSGTSSNGNLFFSDGTSGADEYRGVVQYNHTGNFLRFYTNGAEKLRITSDGFLGISTASVLAPFHAFNATNNTIARLESGDATCRLQLVDSAGMGFVAVSGDNLILANTSSITERLRIDSNGKFCLGTYNSNFASNDGIVSIVNAASGGTENPLLTLWNPTTVADARASIDFLTNAQYGTARDGAFIRASNDGSTAKAHLIFGTILNETYTKTVKFDTNGDVELVDGDLVIQTSGHGIDFSAAANSNAGASSSILNDYEEGVYQPTMTGSSGGSHTFQTYTHIGYTRIGRLVHIQGYININGGSLTGNLKLSLPFTVSNDATGHSRYAAIGLSWRGHGWSGNTGEITFAPQPNTTYGEFVSVSNNGSHIWVNNGHVNNNYNIRIGGSYITNS